MKTLLLLLALGTVPVLVRAQTVPFDASAPMRGGTQNQTVVPPVNPALNQSTIQGPTQVQRTLTSNDAQPSRLPIDSTPLAGTPELSPNSSPDAREQPLRPQQRQRQSSDVVPTRSRAASSSNVQQTYRRPAQAPLTPAGPY
jgi:hypothetical protein